MHLLDYEFLNDIKSDDDFAYWDYSDGWIDE